MATQLCLRSWQNITQIYIYKVMKVQLVIVLFLIFPAVICWRPKSKWEITRGNESVSPWGIFADEYQNKSAICRWIFAKSKKEIFLDMHDEFDLATRLQIDIYFNYSLSDRYPSYDSKAHASYYYYQNQEIKIESDEFDIMPHVMLENLTLTLYEDSGDMLQVHLKYDSSNFIFFLTVVHFYLKMKIYFRIYKIYQAKLSVFYVICLLFWQFNIFGANGSHFQYIILSFNSLLGQIIGYGGMLLAHLAITYLYYIYPRKMIYIAASFFLLIVFNSLISLNLQIILASQIPLIPILSSMKMNKIAYTDKLPLFCYWINIFLALYSRGCPYNFMMHKTNYGVCVFVAIASVLLSYVWHLQIKKGIYLGSKRFKYMWHRSQFNYYREIVSGGAETSLNELVEQEVCPICLSAINDEHLLKKVRINESEMKVGTIMETPCSHRYHVGCLKLWMNEKRQCPIDKLALPVPEDDDQI